MLNSFLKEFKQCFEGDHSLQTRYQPSEGGNLIRAANIIAVQTEEGKLDEIRLKYIETCSKACYRYNPVRPFKKDCPYGQVDGNYTSVSIIDQMHHGLLENSPIMENVLK